MSDIDGIAAGFHAAFAAGAGYEPPSVVAPLDLQQAYAVQRAFNRLRARSDAVAGYKAGMNAAAAQRALGLSGPATGVLFSSGARPPGTTVARSEFRNLVLETELGFRTARPIAAPVDTVAELRSAIATVAPMFELADPRYGRAAIRGTDMIAANLACGGFVEGPAREIGAVDLNAIEVRLGHDGKPVHEARADELLGDHWEALRWLVNAVVAQGQVIEAGQLLMTGALGGAHPAQPGAWVAEFGALGRVEVRIV
jgi:2-keto-4-pentenoate hydratase